jgi:hypothetical protein
MKRSLLNLVIVCFLIQGCANTPERYGHLYEIHWLVDVVSCDFAEINVSNFQTGWQTVRWDVYCDEQDKDFKCWQRGGLDVPRATVCVLRSSHALNLPAGRSKFGFGSCVSDQLNKSFEADEYITFFDGVLMSSCKGFTRTSISLINYCSLFLKEMKPWTTESEISRLLS